MKEVSFIEGIISNMWVSCEVAVNALKEVYFMKNFL